MEQDDRAFEARILQVQIEKRQVAGQTKGFVNERPRGAGDDEELRPAHGNGGAISGLADQEQFALEEVFSHSFGPANEQLLDAWHRLDRLVAEGAGIDGNHSPNDRVETSSAYRAIHCATSSVRLIFVPGQKGHGHAKLTRPEIGMPGGRECFREQGERDLGQYASAIAGAGVGADAPAMSQIDESGQGALNDPA
jgi:hypothetical protein